MHRWLVVTAIGVTFAAQGTPLAHAKSKVAEAYIGQATSDATNASGAQQVTPDAIQLNTPAQNQSRNNADPNTDHETLLTWFTGVLAVMAVIQSIILGLTVHAIDRQTSTVQNSERAWILADLDNERGVYGGGWSTDSPYSDLTLTCKNDGKTPAWITEIRARLEIAEAAPTRPILHPERHGDFVDQGVRPLAVDGAPCVVQVDCHGNRSRDSGLKAFVYGVIKYRSVFGPDRQTWFGYEIGGTRPWARMTNPEYNNYT